MLYIIRAIMYTDDIFVAAASSSTTREREREDGGLNLSILTNFLFFAVFCPPSLSFPPPPPSFSCSTHLAPSFFSLCDAHFSAGPVLGEPGQCDVAFAAAVSVDVVVALCAETIMEWPYCRRRRSQANNNREAFFFWYKYDKLAW